MYELVEVVFAKEAGIELHLIERPGDEVGGRGLAAAGVARGGQRIGCDAMKPCGALGVRSGTHTTEVVPDAPLDAELHEGAVEQRAADAIAGDVLEELGRVVGGGVERDVLDAAEQADHAVGTNVPCTADEKDAVEPAAQHCRGVVPPDGEDKRKMFAGSEVFEIALDERVVWATGAVVGELGWGHCGGESICIKIVNNDFLALLLQPLCQGLEDGVAKAPLIGMAVDDQRAHHFPFLRCVRCQLPQ